jgi:hypothetical protein
LVYLGSDLTENGKANKVLDRPIIQNEGPTAYILRYIVIKKGIIKNVPEDMKLENMMHQLTLDNHNKRPIPFQIIDAVRLKMRVKEMNEETRGRKVGVERVEGSMF